MWAFEATCSIHKNLLWKKIFGSWMVAPAAITILPFNTVPVFAAESFSTYTNDRYGTSFKYPSSWSAQEGKLSGERSVNAFIDPSSPDTSVSVVFTAIPADFTNLNAFGGKENIRSYLLPKGEDVKTTLLEEKLSGNSYSLEYTISAPLTTERHVQSIFALRPQESVIGLTIQTKESDYNKVKDTLKSIEASFNVEN